MTRQITPATAVPICPQLKPSIDPRVDRGGKWNWVTSSPSYV